jgi:hypothetical protein
LINKILQGLEGGIQEFAWTRAYWQLFAMAAELLPCPNPPRRDAAPFTTLIERTPLLFASQTEGWVVNLCVERRPGPPGLITPDWWRLGLFPLGANNELLIAIHDGFRVALEHYGEGKRIHLRWWLEKHAKTQSLLFDTITEGGSVAVAAACVARVLLEEDRGAPRTLLDDGVAVSGTLGDISAGTGFDQHKVGLVGYHDKKIEAAQDAGLIAVLLAADSDKKLFTPDQPGETKGILVQPVTTLDHAYDSLLITSQAVAEYKQRVVEHWDKLWYEKETPEEPADETESSDEDEPESTDE